MLTFLRWTLIAIVMIAVAIGGLWGALAIWFQLPAGETVRMLVAAIFGLLGLATVLAQFSRGRIRMLAVFSSALAGILVWWQTLDPPAEANWAPDVSQKVRGTVEGDILTLDAVRNFEWRTLEEFTEQWESRSYDLSTLETMDLFMSYWGDPNIAHMIISFGFADGDYLAWSVEVRRTLDSAYSPIADAFKTHTLILIAADERDVVGTRSNIRGEDVQLYRLNVSPDRARRLLMKYVDASNALADEPRWYNSVTANCTTEVFNLIRTISDRIPLDWRVFINGYLPEFAYDQDVLDSDVSLPELKKASHIKDRALKEGLTPEFSSAIREGVPSPLDH